MKWRPFPRLSVHDSRLISLLSHSFSGSAFSRSKIKLARQNTYKYPICWRKKSDRGFFSCCYHTSMSSPIYLQCLTCKEQSRWLSADGPGRNATGRPIQTQIALRDSYDLQSECKSGLALSFIYTTCASHMTVCTRQWWGVPECKYFGTVLRDPGKWIQRFIFF